MIISTPKSRNIRYLYTRYPPRPMSSHAEYCTYSHIKSLVDYYLTDMGNDISWEEEKKAYSSSIDNYIQQWERKHAGG